MAAKGRGLMGTLLMGGAATAILGLRRRVQATGRAVRAVRADMDRAARVARGRWAGFSYRLSGATPNLMPGDDVLVDRVRSSIGTLLSRLDLPHPNVMVVNAVAILHGAVGSADEQRQIEKAVADVPGIEAVRSELHVGLGRGDTRPSASTRHETSRLLITFRDCARLAGRDGDQVIAATISAFLSRIPEGERRHVIGHLPKDVRALLDPAVLRGELLDVRNPDELVAQAARAVPGIARRQLERIVPALIGALRAAVPDEAGDVRAVLPEPLRRLWAPVQVG